eukprot:3359539-Ditylum_brightwellii.AAC.1
MVRVWKKIGHADKKHEAGVISLLQISITWPPTDYNENNTKELVNLQKVVHWRTVDTPKNIAFI